MFFFSPWPQVEACARKIFNAKLVAAFNAMQENAYLALKKRQSLSFWVNRAMSSAFQTWKSEVETRKVYGDKLERAALFWTHGAMHSAFTGWREAASHLAAKKDSARMAVNHFVNRSVGQASGSRSNEWL